MRVVREGMSQSEGDVKRREEDVAEKIEKMLSLKQIVIRG